MSQNRGKLPSGQEKARECRAYFKKRLGEAKINLKRDIFGFLDESSLELNPRKTKILLSVICRVEQVRRYRIYYK